MASSAAILQARWEVLVDWMQPEGNQLRIPTIQYAIMSYYMANYSRILFNIVRQNIDLKIVWSCRVYDQNCIHSCSPLQRKSQLLIQVVDNESAMCRFGYNDSIIVPVCARSSQLPPESNILPYFTSILLCYGYCQKYKYC